MMTKPYYTLFVCNQIDLEWEDVFGSYVRRECLDEREFAYYDDKCKIIKTDGSHEALMAVFRDLNNLEVPA
jgi:hypothetical protein